MEKRFKYHDGVKPHSTMPFQMLMLRVLLVFLLAAKVAGAQSLPPAVEQELKRAQIPLSSVGAWVQDVDGGRPHVAHNAAQSMNPASTMKLVTTYAALSL
ncbi:MAG: D-alanyl-D-alanine carboxypeptidase, partial [Pseudomonadota bacterium]